MARIAVIGGTGYAGSHIVAEAVDRGHTVVSVARSVPAERIEGATYIEGTLLDVPGLVAELEGVDVIVSAVAPRGDMLGQAAPQHRRARRRARRRDVRLGVIGGAGGSLVARGRRARRRPAVASPRSTSPRRSRRSTSSKTCSADDGGARLVLHPPRRRLRRLEPGRAHRLVPRRRRRARHRRRTASPTSPAPDFAVAVLDEIENPKHSRERFTVGY